MKLIYPSQSVASALRSPASGLVVRTRCMRQTIYLAPPLPWPPCDIVIHHHFRVHPVRAVDKGVPSFPATCEFDHSRLDREKAHDPCSPRTLSGICLDYDIASRKVEKDFSRFFTDTYVCVENFVRDVVNS